MLAPSHKTNASEAAAAKPSDGDPPRGRAPDALPAEDLAKVLFFFPLRRARLLIECPDEKLCPATRAPGDQRAPNDGFPATAAGGLASDPNLDASAPERFG